MSHTMNIETEIRDTKALSSACNRLNLDFDQNIAPRKFYSTTETGMAVNLDGWKYPVVIQENGKLAYDNYNGSWGEDKELGKLKAYYGSEKAKIEARKKGYSVNETIDAVNGNLKLKICVGR